jgi:uncharacterized protein (DUF1800 family)
MLLALASHPSFAEEQKPTPVEAARAASQKATADRDAAKKVLDEKIAAANVENQKAVEAKAAADKAAAAKVLADKALAEKSAAEKSVNEREAAVRAANETILAEEAYAANEAVKTANNERAKAEKTLTDKTTAAQQKATAATAARGAAEQAEAARVACEKELTGKSADQKPAAEKALAEKANAANAAAEKSKAAAAAEAAAVAERAAAEKTLAEKAAAIPALLEQAAIAQANLVGGLKPLASSAWDYAKARHLLWRAGFGGTPEEVAKLQAMGLQGAVEYLVDFQKQPEPNCSVDIRLPEPATIYENRLTEPERTKLGNERTSRRFQQLAQLRYWWLRRMVETQRPLEEKLVLFWHGHFAVNFTKNENPHVMWRQNEHFRNYAAGNFGGLLRGIAQDPAMISYLDNQVNFKGAGNENLGREILELFSMGEGQGYTEQDLREASRALTGYSYEHSTGLFKFIATRHDETPKTIFGRTGNWGGDDLVDMILQQPSTARFIATKLFRYFVHESPTPETIDRLANVLRITNYDLSAMLRNLFLSEEFYSPAALASHIKSPAELMVGTLRTLGGKDVDYGSVDGALQTMGQTLFEPPNVKGWDGGRDWINTSRLLVRYNSVVTLADRGAIDLAGLFESKGVYQPEAIVDYLAKAFLVMPIDEVKRTELIRFLEPLPQPPDWPKQHDAINAKLRAALATLLSTPEYQLSQDLPPCWPAIASAPSTAFHPLN